MSRSVKELFRRGVYGVSKESSAKSVKEIGLCCPHCSDSKYPCVTMQKVMSAGGKNAPRDKKQETGR